jgi:imidazolonepropionase-like amidohydrolase
MGSDRPLREGRLLQQRVMALGHESVSRERLTQLGTVWAQSGVFYTPTLRHNEAVLEGSVPEDYRRPFEGRLAATRLFVRELSARGVRLLVGQDGFAPDGTWEEMEALGRAGVPPLEILRGVTIYPAQFLRIEDSVSTLAQGKRADVVILERNPLQQIENVRSVWKVVYAGKVVSERSPQ